MRSATVAPEKGAAAMAATAAARSRAWPPQTPSAKYEGVHNAALSPGETYSPRKFRLEHHLDQDHPLRHPKAVHWRSAYSVIALHKKMKDLRASGGGGSGDLQTSFAPSGSPDSDPTSGECEELREENATLKQKLSEKTSTLQEVTKLLAERDAELKEAHARAQELVTEKDAELKEAQARAQDMAFKMEQLAKSGVEIHSLMSKVEEMEQFRLKQIAKAARRWKNADISRAFRRWHTHVSETVKNRNLIMRFSARWNTNSLAGVFIRWHDKTKQVKHNMSKHAACVC